jgi:hypothetical protein
MRRRSSSLFLPARAAKLAIPILAAVCVLGAVLLAIRTLERDLEGARLVGFSDAPGRIRTSDPRSPGPSSILFRRTECYLRAAAIQERGWPRLLCRTTAPRPDGKGGERARDRTQMVISLAACRLPPSACQIVDRGYICGRRNGGQVRHRQRADRHGAAALLRLLAPAERGGRNVRDTPRKALAAEL